MNNTLSLQELFSKRIFQVPDYQRGYAWEERQVAEFLDDLRLLASSSPGYRHYTGTIVLCSQSDEVEDDGGRSYEVWDIVDGQQRLTTVVLLLNEVSRALGGYPNCDELAKGIERDYVRTSRDGLPLYKMTLNKGTDDFFKSVVLREKPDVVGPPIASAQRLQNAQKQIADYLTFAGDSTADREQWLRELRSNITGRLHFNLYEVEDAAAVGTIFEVMNDRGKPLTDLEKVKNYLLHATSPLDVEESSKGNFVDSVNDAWAYILDQLMSAGLSSPADEDRLLRAHWLMQYDPQSQNWSGSKSIKDKFDFRNYHRQSVQLLGDLQQYIDGLRSASICYCDALNPDRSDAFQSFSSHPGRRDDVKLWNSKLVRIGVTATFLPLLMAVRTRWPSDPQKYLEVVRLCEALAFRFYTVAQYRANFRQSHMFRLANRVYHGMEFNDISRYIKQTYNVNDERRGFAEFTDVATPRNWYGRRGLRYFLYEYEQDLASAKDASPRVNWKDISSTGLKDTIEHILPQSIENQPYWQAHFDKTTHNEHLHDVGNLTLTKHNSFYGNKPFPEKKGMTGADYHCYTESPFFQEQELAQHDDWTVTTINKRRAKLLGWAKERWHVDFSDVDVAQPESDDDDEDRDAREV